MSEPKNAAFMADTLAKRAGPGIKIKLKVLAANESLHRPARGEDDGGITDLLGRFEQDP